MKILIKKYVLPRVYLISAEKQLRKESLIRRIFNIAFREMLDRIGTQKIYSGFDLCAVGFQKHVFISFRKSHACSRFSVCHSTFYFHFS